MIALPRQDFLANASARGRRYFPPWRGRSRYFKLNESDREHDVIVVGRGKLPTQKKAVVDDDERTMNAAWPSRSVSWLTNGL